MDDTEREIIDLKCDVHALTRMVDDLIHDTRALRGAMGQGQSTHMRSELSTQQYYKTRENEAYRAQVQKEMFISKSTKAKARLNQMNGSRNATFSDVNRQRMVVADAERLARASVATYARKQARLNPPK